MSEITVDEFYNSKFELSGKDAKEFTKQDERSLTLEEKDSLNEAWKYYKKTCKAE